MGVFSCSSLLLLAIGTSAFEFRIPHISKQFSCLNGASLKRYVDVRRPHDVRYYNYYKFNRRLAAASNDAFIVPQPEGSKAATSIESSSQESSNTEAASLQTVLSATFGLMKAILGSGCLALPFGLAAASNHPSSLYAANALLLALGVLSAYTFSLYGRLAHETNAKSLGEMWKTIFTATKSSSKISNDTSWIVSAANLIYCLGCCLTFSLVIGDSLSGLLKGSGLVSGIWATRQASILGVTGAVLLPLVQLPSLAALAPVSVIGVLGTIIIAAFMTLRCPAIVTSSPYAVSAASSFGKRMLASNAPNFGTYSRLYSPAPLILVAMACVAWMAHFSAPDFYHSFTETQLSNASTAAVAFNSKGNSEALRKYNLTTVIGYGLVAIVNAVIISAGFLTFGGSCQGMILNNYSSLDRGASLCRVLVLISMIGGFPFVFQGCLSSAMDLAKSKQSQAINHIETAVKQAPRAAAQGDKLRKRMIMALMSIITATALIVKDAGFVVSFNGALMGTAIIYIFPALLFLKLTSSEPFKSGSNRRSKWLRIERGFSKFLVSFGGVSAIVGALTAVLNSYFPHLLR
ncbi:hypothetical protein MPSEU_001024700 [Mayamaea pseudoterrestris]|nr:hypothetical protein MPSEU_001024700 [Mayamaea pseudoterrestris]